MTSNDDLLKTASEKHSAEAEKAHNEMKRALSEDLHDSPEDEERMKGETVVIDLPDVSDIPGQESIVVPQMGEMADVTIASDDEEGVGIFGDDAADEDTDLVMGTNADVTTAEQTMLARAGNEVSGDEELRRAAPDATDDDGEQLNEGTLTTHASGSDLDTAVVDADNAMEAIGEEDEENNPYSLGGDDKDNATEGNP